MEDRVVCTCLDITYNTIKEAIENGAKTLDDIKDETEAGRFESRTLLKGAQSYLVDLLRKKWRREGDSNPRSAHHAQRFSRPPH